MMEAYIEVQDRNVPGAQTLADQAYQATPHDPVIISGVAFIHLFTSHEGLDLDMINHGLTIDPSNVELRIFHVLGVLEQSTTDTHALLADVNHLEQAGLLHTDVAEIREAISVLASSGSEGRETASASRMLKLVMKAHVRHFLMKLSRTEKLIKPDALLAEVDKLEQAGMPHHEAADIRETISIIKNTIVEDSSEDTQARIFLRKNS